MERVAGACAYCTCTRTSPSGQQQCICTRRPHSLICMERNYRCLLCNCSSAQWEGKKDYHPAPYPSQSFKSMRTCCNVWWRIWVILSSSDSLHGREEECIHSPSPPHDGFLGLFPLGSSCRLSRDSRCLQRHSGKFSKEPFSDMKPTGLCFFTSVYVLVCLFVYAGSCPLHCNASSNVIWQTEMPVYHQCVCVRTHQCSNEWTQFSVLFR